MLAQVYQSLRLLTYRLVRESLYSCGQGYLEDDEG